MVEAILALALAEALALCAFHRATGRGPAPARLLPNLAAGIALLLALRLAIGGAWWGWLALCLASAGLAHLADLRARWHG